MSSLPILLSTLLLATSTHAQPLTKRDMTIGARAGLGVGIAVAVILVIGLITFLIIHFRRVRHIKQINRERAILAGEKNPDGTDKEDKFAMPEPQVSAIPRRNKSVKDRLMGPLYRGSVIDMHPLPRAKLAGQDRSNRASTMTMELGHDGLPLVGKPFAPSESSPRASFSSKRATRMMMMM